MSSREAVCGTLLVALAVLLYHPPPPAPKHQLLCYWRFLPEVKLIQPGVEQGLATDHVEFDDIWGILSQSLQEIHHKNASCLSFEELYRNAYKLVLKKHGEKLYMKVKALLRDHLQEVGTKEVKPLCPGAIVSGSAFGAAAIERRDGGNRFLAGLKNAWEDHQLCLGMMRDVLMYLVSSLMTNGSSPWY